MKLGCAVSLEVYFVAARIVLLLDVRISCLFCAVLIYHLATAIAAKLKQNINVAITQVLICENQDRLLFGRRD